MTGMFFMVDMLFMMDMFFMVGMLLGVSTAYFMLHTFECSTQHAKNNILTHV